MLGLATGRPVPGARARAQQQQQQLRGARCAPAARPRGAEPPHHPARRGLTTRPRAEPDRPQQQQQQRATTSTPSVPAAPPSPTPSPPPPPTPEEEAAAAWPPPRPSLAVALDKAAATADDIALILRRTLSPGSGPRVRSTSSGADGTTTTLRSTKPVVLVLGAGWAAHALLKVIDHTRFDAINVSPRNHFLFTPMLPSAAVGTVEFRSILEPMRAANPQVTYVEAAVDDLDLEKKVARCTAVTSLGGGEPRSFVVPYDVVVVAVGEQPATFGVPGVREHAVFLKEISDARAMRQRIGELFELAALPGTSLEDAKKLLSFVVVGGGPTGVEFAGTLADFLRVDLRAKFPRLVREAVSVTLLQSASTILNVFSSVLQERALKTLRAEGVDVKLGVRVTAVHADRVDYKTPDGAPASIPAGMTLWSAGNSSRPLVRDMVQARPDLAKFAPNPVTAKIAVDPWCRIIGASDALAIGDAAAMVGRRLPPTAQVAGQQGAYVARLLNKGFRVGVGGFEAPPAPPAVGATGGPAAVAASWEAALASVDFPEGMDEDAILAASEEAVEGRRPGTPAGRAVARALSGRGPNAAAGPPGPGTAPPPPPRPFEFLSLGLLAYVGMDSGVSDIAIPGLKAPVKVSGRLAFLLWRSVYAVKQVSTRTRVLVLFDWLKTRVFGRDLSLF
jgi:NADH:ubiquinone reductase (non-electrogenic)